MGLDLVEIHMELEDHFGIRLPNDQLYPETVGGLFDVIRTQFERRGRGERRGFHLVC